MMIDIPVRPYLTNNGFPVPSSQRCVSFRPTTERIKYLSTQKTPNQTLLLYS